MVVMVVMVAVVEFVADEAVDETNLAQFVPLALAAVDSGHP